MLEKLAMVTEFSSNSAYFQGELKKKRLPLMAQSRSLLRSSFLSSPALFFGDQVILFSFFSLRLALANHVDTWVRVILVMIANMIFSPLVGYGFLRCSYSHVFRVLVVSRVAFFLRAVPLKSTVPYLLKKKKKERDQHSQVQIIIMFLQQEAENIPVVLILSQRVVVGVVCGCLRDARV